MSSISNIGSDAVDEKPQTVQDDLIPDMKRGPCESDEPEIQTDEEEVGHKANSVPSVEASSDGSGNSNTTRHLKIKKPWLYDSQKPMSDPPGINYRNLILADQEQIESLLENESLHFTERCLNYQRQDINVEGDILFDYRDWTKYMLEDAGTSGNQAREKLFWKLSETVWRDYNDVHDEEQALFEKEAERSRRPVAQKLNIPFDHKDWTEV